MKQKQEPVPQNDNDLTSNRTGASRGLVWESVVRHVPLGSGTVGAEVGLAVV
jgi:hypothetical protein